MVSQMPYRWTNCLVAATLLLAPLASSVGVTPVAAAATDRPTADRVVFFAADGMRPDLMENYAAQGYMPTYQQLMQQGVRGENGLTQGFPPNTGVGWYTLNTGTWPGEHGSTNNTFFRAFGANNPPTPFTTTSTSFSASGILQADTLAAAAERAGKKVAQVDWVGGLNSGITGPTVDYANFFSMRGVAVYPSDGVEQAGASAFGVAYLVISPTLAMSWTNEPAGDPNTPPMEATFVVSSTNPGNNPHRMYDLYFYDTISDTNRVYNRLLLVPVSAGKSANLANLALSVGDFKEVKLFGANGLTGSRANQTASFYAKLVSLSADLSTFKLYFTSVSRLRASCTAAVCASLPAGGAGEDRLERYLADNAPGFIAADFAPLEARIIDEATYVQQGLQLQKAYGDAVLNYILGTLQPDTELALVGYPVTDEFSHQFLGLLTPTDMDGNPNPYYDDIENDDVADNRLTIREGYIRSAYMGADMKLAHARHLLGGNPTTVASSDHGFAPQWYAVNARKVMFDAQVTLPNSTTVSLHGSGGSTASNCAALATDYVKTCWAGGTMQVYLNPNLVGASTSSPTYTAVFNAVMSTFQTLTDTANPSATVVARVLTKAELRNVDGSDSLHPNRSGDIVVVLRPPYQWDAATPGERIAFSQFFGQHGYMPELVDLAHNVNMHGVFVAAGPGFRSHYQVYLPFVVNQLFAAFTALATGQTPIQAAAPRDAVVTGVRAIDLAPTIAFLLNIPGPQNARGRILYNTLPNGGANFQEVTFLQISDFHGQLIPLAEAADNNSGAATYNIGGAAYLKTWWDWYEAEAQDGTIRLSSGDSQGATPPISAFFGDTPTVDIMNLMAIDYDGLGNHNFDAGANYLTSTLIPRADYPHLSSNLVFSGTTNSYPPSWKPYDLIQVGEAMVGLIGFSNDDLEDSLFPGAIAPFVPLSSTAKVNEYAALLQGMGADAVVAFGHHGATGGTLTNPTGPLVDLADNVTNVDAVLGDHTNYQVLATRPNGVLVTENLSKGPRFTRIRLVVDTDTGAVIYKTADWHKPWNLGVTPDPAIQAEITTLNALVNAALGTVIGQSNVAVPRADACGRADGRLCESLVGDIVTDAMLDAYEAIGVDFALTNAGGLRADLTCPTVDNPNDTCPAITPPAYLISRGSVLGVLPFGNIVATVPITGPILKTYLENGISSMPGANGRFPQISGLCFSYNISNTVGTRVVSATHQLPNGSCGGAAIDFSPSATYMIAINDFMASGGDGYPAVTAFPGYTTQAIMDQVVADYITAQGTLSPTIQGRIKCEANGTPNGGACPVGGPTFNFFLP